MKNNGFLLAYDSFPLTGTYFGLILGIPHDMTPVFWGFCGVQQKWMLLYKKTYATPEDNETLFSLRKPYSGGTLNWAHFGPRSIPVEGLEEEFFFFPYIKENMKQIRNLFGDEVSTTTSQSFDGTIFHKHHLQIIPTANADGREE